MYGRAEPLVTPMAATHFLTLFGSATPDPTRSAATRGVPHPASPDSDRARGVPRCAGVVRKIPHVGSGVVAAQEPQKRLLRRLRRNTQHPLRRPGGAATGPLCARTLLSDIEVRPLACAAAT